MACAECPAQGRRPRATTAGPGASGASTPGLSPGSLLCLRTEGKTQNLSDGWRLHHLCQEMERTHFQGLAEDTRGRKDPAPGPRVAWASSQPSGPGEREAVAGASAPCQVTGGQGAAGQPAVGRRSPGALSPQRAGGETGGRKPELVVEKQGARDAQDPAPGLHLRGPLLSQGRSRCHVGPTLGVPTPSSLSSLGPSGLPSCTPAPTPLVRAGPVWALLRQSRCASSLPPLP